MDHKRIAKWYARFVHRYHLAMLIVSLLITVALGFQIQNVIIEPMDYKTFLPADSKTMEGLNFVEDTFISTDSAQVLIMKRDGYGVDWAQDDIISYVDNLEQAINKIPYVDYTLSYVSTLEQKNSSGIRRQELYSLMDKETILYPIDPFSEVESYVQSFDELDKGIKKQHEAIKELTNSSGSLAKKIGSLKEGALRIKQSTAIHDKEVGTDELTVGISELSVALHNLSSDISNLSEGIRATYCEPKIIDPVYGPTEIDNPYYNDTSCYAYQNRTIEDSYRSLRDTYCTEYLPSPPYSPNTPNPHYNETRCNTYNAILSSMDKDFSYYEGLNQISYSIDNQMIPALAELEAGSEEAGEGLREFKANILEINKGMEELVQYLRLLQAGMKEYNKNMVVLEQETEALSKNISDYNEQVSSTYKMLNDTVDTDYEAQEYLISDKKEFGKFFSSDGTSTRIHVLFRKGVDKEYISGKLKDVTASVEPPGNLKSLAIGDMLRFDKLQGMIPHEVMSTSLFAAVLIITIILFLIRRPVMSLLTLSTILFGTIWTFGILGSINMNLNPASSGIISMLLGIGIDFGIQIISEFIKFFKSSNLENALAKTFEITMTPILITTGSAMLGFFAMGLAQVTIMQDMSRILMLGTPMYFLAAFIVLPAALTCYTNFKQKIRGEHK
ncbi:MAG: MMPL family transporter [Candidatus Woesearchaeota archaeon]